jgi:RNA polymerase sigma-70 factor (ECF subfamily)
VRLNDLDTARGSELRDDVTTTEELVAAVAKGDERAFGLVYDRLAAPVMGVVHAVVRDHAQSEEVVQEVFVELWRTAARYQPARGKVRAWAITVAHHRAVDRVRSSQAHAERERASHVREYPGSDYDGVVEEVLESLERRQVRNCLRTLTALERESIMLAYYRALTYREVADRLSVATSTVKYRMRAGLRRLRDCLTSTLDE